MSLGVVNRGQEPGYNLRKAVLRVNHIQRTEFPPAARLFIKSVVALTTSPSCSLGSDQSANRSP
jgi:hypothetical protein